MRTGFSLNQLVDFYIEKMGVLAWSRKYKDNLPAYAVYQDVMEVLSGVNAVSDFGRDLAKKYKEKIIGKTCVSHADQLYWDLGVIKANEVRLHEWKTYSLHERAQVLAHHYIKNMVEVIDSYYRNEDDVKKKQEEAGKSRMDKLKRGGKQQNDSAGSESA